MPGVAVGAELELRVGEDEAARLGDRRGALEDLERQRRAAARPRSRPRARPCARTRCSRRARPSAPSTRACRSARAAGRRSARPSGSGMPPIAPGRLVLLPAAAREVAAHDALDREHVERAAERRPVGDLGGDRGHARGGRRRRRRGGSGTSGSWSNHQRVSAREHRALARDARARARGRTRSPGRSRPRAPPARGAAGRPSRCRRRRARPSARRGRAPCPSRRASSRRSSPCRHGRSFDGGASDVPRHSATRAAMSVRYWPPSSRRCPSAS